MSQAAGPGDPRVTVVIPTLVRDRGQLQRAVDSVMQQTSPANEVIVVVDDPVAAVPSFAESRVVVVRNERTPGPAGARNHGVELATGRFIAWLDDDDWWLPSKLARQRELIAQVPQPDSTVLATRVRQLTARRVLVAPDRSPASGERLVDYLFPTPGWLTSPRRSLATPSLLVPRALLRRIPLREDLRRWEDYDWLLEAVDSGAALIVDGVIGCCCDATRASGPSLSQRRDPDADLEWARRSVLPRSRAAYVTFVMSHVLPGLVDLGQSKRAALLWVKSVTSGVCGVRQAAKGAAFLLLPPQQRARFGKLRNSAAARVAPHSRGGQP